MAKGTINKVTLVARLGADPETRFMPNGNAVTNLRLATNEGYKDKNSGQFVESTEWHRVVIFGRLAEIAAEYLKKGRLVYIEGRLRTNKWQDQSGQDRYTTEIVANEMQLLGGQNDGASSGGSNNYQSNQSHNQSQNSFSNNSAPQASMAASTAPSPAGMEVDKFDDDDIPF